VADERAAEFSSEQQDDGFMAGVGGDLRWTAEYRIASD
jgi:hypothetical protein